MLRILYTIFNWTIFYAFGAIRNNVQAYQYQFLFLWKMIFFRSKYNPKICSTLWGKSCSITLKYLQNRHKNLGYQEWLLGLYTKQKNNFLNNETNSFLETLSMPDHVLCARKKYTTGQPRVSSGLMRLVTYVQGLVANKAYFLWQDLFLSFYHVVNQQKNKKIPIFKFNPVNDISWTGYYPLNASTIPAKPSIY